VRLRAVLARSVERHWRGGSNAHGPTKPVVVVWQTHIAVPAINAHGRATHPSAAATAISRMRRRLSRASTRAASAAEIFSAMGCVSPHRVVGIRNNSTQFDTIRNNSGQFDNSKQFGTIRNNSERTCVSPHSSTNAATLAATSSPCSTLTYCGGQRKGSAACLGRGSKTAPAGSKSGFGRRKMAIKALCGCISETGTGRARPVPQNDSQ
jgi:hypothetical protein